MPTGTVWKIQSCSCHLSLPKTRAVLIPKRFYYIFWQSAISLAYLEIPFVLTMAFNHHLESDSVGDIGFFNIVRAPIGLVLWALGGNHDEDVCRGKEKIGRKFSEDIEEERRITDSLRLCPGNFSSANFNKGNKASPSMVRSEVSDMSNYQQEFLQERMAAVQLNSQQALSSCDLLKKKLSWSDEIGKNLAFEVSYRYHNRCCPLLSTVGVVRSSKPIPFPSFGCSLRCPFVLGIKS